MLFPINDYKPSKLPTMQEMQANPAPLKQMPNRWRKKAAVIACASFIGASALFSSCDILNEISSLHKNTVSEPLELRFHHGGFASSPTYIVHLTEADALGIIRMQLEDAGLEFGANPPNYGIDINFSRVESVLFDNKNNVAIVQAGFTAGFAEHIADELTKQTDDIIFGVFYSPSGTFPGNSWRITPSRMTPSYEKREGLRPILLEQLNNQIEDFIQLLREKGII